MKLIQWSRSCKRAYGWAAHVSRRLCSSLCVLSFGLEVVTVRTGCWTAWGRGSAYCCSVTESCLTLELHDVQHTRLVCASLSPGACSVTSVESVMPSNHLILCRPLLPPPSIFPSIRVFSHESTLRIRWSKYWNLSFSISPSNEYLVLISFRIDWLDLLAVQGTLKSLLQHYSSLWYNRDVLRVVKKKAEEDVREAISFVLISI